MMDIQKEREAFEELIDIEIIISEGFKFNPNINQYYHPDHTNHRLSYAYLMGAWMVWQEKTQAVPEGFVLVGKELPESIAEAMALERVNKPFGETDPVWVEITEKVYKEHLVSKKWELWRDYKAMIEAQESAK